MTRKPSKLLTRAELRLVVKHLRSYPPGVASSYFKDRHVSQPTEAFLRCQRDPTSVAEG
jgi:hypothetical protein